MAEAGPSSNRDAILEDIEQLLAESGKRLTPAHEEIADQLDEALRAARAGLDRAAQALLATTLGIVIHEVLGFELLGEAYKRLKGSDPEDAVLAELRFVALELVTANALIDTDQGPDGFNRHGTQHGLTEFLSEGRLLAGFLLLAGWTRELSWRAEREAGAGGAATTTANGTGRS